jgi:hypothetical protein
MSSRSATPQRLWDLLLPSRPSDEPAQEGLSGTFVGYRSILREGFDLDSATYSAGWPSLLFQTKISHLPPTKFDWSLAQAPIYEQPDPGSIPPADVFAFTTSPMLVGSLVQNSINSSVFRSPTTGKRLEQEPQDTSASHELVTWEGFVEELTGDSMICRLVDKGGERPDQRAEIPLHEVSEADSDLVEPGGIFYWSLAYSDVDGSRRHISQITFRRLPRYPNLNRQMAPSVRESGRHVLADSRRSA